MKWLPETVAYQLGKGEVGGQAYVVNVRCSALGSSSVLLACMDAVA